MSFEKILPLNSKRRKFFKKVLEPFKSNLTEEERIYKKWINNNEPNFFEIRKQCKEKFRLQPKISIVVPLYNTKEEFFRDLIMCMFLQTYSNWELCLADASEKPLDFIDKYCKNDSRIKYKKISDNRGISGNTNIAIQLATGEYIGLLDHDDILPRFSMYEIVKAINSCPEVEFIYSDEDKLETVKGPRYGVFFKPDFSPYTLNSANYICHFCVFSKNLMSKLNGLNSEYDGSQDFDIVSRASELTSNIIHIPKVLYHWRAHKDSTAQNSDSKPYAYEIGKKVIKDHIRRSLNEDVEVVDGLTPGSYSVKYFSKIECKVSIILDLPDYDEKDIKIILEKIKVSSYKNIEIILISNKNIKIAEIGKIIKLKGNYIETYNEAVQTAEGKYFIIMDENLISIDSDTYIEDLLGICQDESVGIVGTKLYNAKRNIEHNGIILGMNGMGDFLYKGVPKDAGTYMQRLSIIHNVSCVYIKYAMINKAIFCSNGMFNCEFSGLASSIDICLNILKSGKQVIMNPNVSFCIEKLNNIEKIERENSILYSKWRKYYSNGDKYFSPNLSLHNTNISINI